MLYAIMAVDVKDSLDKRKLVRKQHITRLEDLKNQGRLIIAGPHPIIDANDPAEAGFSGSLVIAEFESLAVAQSWASADPYLISGAYESVSVKPFKQVLP